MGRWFSSSIRRGAAAAARVDGDRAVVTPRLVLRRVIGSGEERHAYTPDVASSPALVGPGDVLGFDRSAVVREDPPAGVVDGDATALVSVELAVADLPWILSLPPAAGSPLPPWLALLVLLDDEGAVVQGDPLPRVVVPPAALPDPATLATWAHVEARTSTEPTPATVASLVGAGSHAVVARLVCPRRLDAEADVVACVVPATAAGRETGLGRVPPPGSAVAPAWSPGQPVELPVYHWWRFRTGAGGSFEDLARRLVPRRASDVPGLGSRTATVTATGVPDGVTASISGVLRVPGTASPEVWTDHAAQEAFVAMLRRRLALPDVAEPGDLPPSDTVVAPPTYGAVLAGARTLDERPWLAALNLEVRHRVAAAIGTRFVQEEQEFLMARAWEQAGEIARANTVLAVAELAAEAGRRAQERHLRPLDATTAGVALGGAAADPGPAGESLRVKIARSAVPAGAAAAPFLRLTRSAGALGRRTRRTRLRSHADATAPVVDAGLAGERVLGAPWVRWVEHRDAPVLTGDLPADSTGRRAAGAMAQVLTGQAGVQQLTRASGIVGLTATAAAFAAGITLARIPVVSSPALRGTRAAVLTAPVVGTAAFPDERGDDVGGAAAVQQAVAGLDPEARQAERIAEVVLLDGGADRSARPFAPIMWHPTFDVPLARELLDRWPEWTAPGVEGLPDDSITVLEQDPGFVESFLLGANHELGRELLWREFPTDRRGTSFVRFWPTPAPAELDEVAAWPAATQLGAHVAAGGIGLVLMVRGEIIRRFPGTIVAAVTGGVESASAVWEHPVTVPAEPGTMVYAFTFSDATGRQFVLRQPIASALFGFDDGASAVDRPVTWADLTWAHLGVPPRGILDPRTVPATAIPTAPEPGTPVGVFPTDSAGFARLAFQRPFQIVYAPEELLPT